MRHIDNLTRTNNWLENVMYNNNFANALRGVATKCFFSMLDMMDWGANQLVSKSKASLNKGICCSVK
jgi:hypothetical protein